jgi:hypothetical protein
VIPGDIGTLNYNIANIVVAAGVNRQFHFVALLYPEPFHTIIENEISAFLKAFGLPNRPSTPQQHTPSIAPLWPLQATRRVTVSRT